MHSFEPARILSGAMVMMFLTSASSCAALDEYSKRVGRDACRSAGTCTVYDGASTHVEPCWPTDDGPMAYPGDANWPFEHGVCDTVEQMNAPWPELSDTRADGGAATIADPRATALAHATGPGSATTAGSH